MKVGTVQTTRMRVMKVVAGVKKKVGTVQTTRTRVMKAVAGVKKKVDTVQTTRMRVKRLMNVERMVKKKAEKRRMMRGVIVVRKVDEAAVVNVHHPGRLPQDVDGLIENPPRGNCCRGVLEKTRLLSRALICQVNASVSHVGKLSSKPERSKLTFNFFTIFLLIIPFS